MNAPEWLKKKRRLYFFLKAILCINDKEYVESVLVKKESIAQNINWDITSKNQKRVLICYLSIEECNKNALLHTNQLEFFQILRQFIKLNFVIDACYCDNHDAIEDLKKNNYDVVFGFGKAYREAIKVWPKAYKIEYFTESPFWYSKEHEIERLEYFFNRTGIKKTPYRTGLFYYESDEKNADTIICMSDSSYFKDCKADVHRVLPHGLKCEKYVHDTNIKEKNSFLVFGTGGYIHKGIDILIDVFNQNPQWQLFICGGLEELKNDGINMNANIHDCGMISVHSDKFNQLASKCSYILLPSCSEGMPTGVLTGMRHGLIPVVTKQIGLDDFSEYCLFFDSYKEPDVKKLLEQIENMEEQQRIDKSNQVYEFANKRFTIEQYSQELYDTLKIIFKNKGLL